MKRRLDQVLVERGLAHSRRAAQALIMSGQVAVDGGKEEKPGTPVAPGAAVTVSGPALPYSSRGGIKLAGGLDELGIDVAGLTAVDIGASTGGFTDCLLQRGAARVFAVDVGHGQIDWKLRTDPRVILLEGLNARHLSPGDLPGLGGGADIAVIDVSFISLRLILPRVPPVLREAGQRIAGGSILALVKPQFEVGRGKVGRGGIVRDAGQRREALAGIAGIAPSMGLSVTGIARSPIAGAEGNQEYFIHLSTRPGGLSPAEIQDHVLKATREGSGEED